MQKNRPLIRRAVFTIALGVGLTLGYSGLLRAQERQSQQTTQTQQESPKTEEKNPTTSGIFLSATQSTDKSVNTQSVSETFFDVNGNDLWLVAGQNNTINVNGKNSSAFDFGLRFSTKQKNLVRFTYFNDNGKSSYGIDWDWIVKRAFDGNVKFAVLGDISSVDFSADKARHIDFGLGGKLTLYDNHNLFFLLSKRGVIGTDSARIGYVYWSKEKLAALVVDHKEGSRDVYNMFIGAPLVRFFGTLDPNTHIISTLTFFTSGNGPLPKYASLELPATQYIFTQRTVTDSDNRYGFQPPFFLTAHPQGTFGEFLKLAFNRNPSDKSGYDFLVYNAILYSMHSGNCIVFTQNATKDSFGVGHYGGGLGYMFANHRITPVLIFQSGGIWTFNLHFRY